jgi:hypothetical protein
VIALITINANDDVVFRVTTRPNDDVTLRPSSTATEQQVTPIENEVVSQAKVLRGMDHMIESIFKEQMDRELRLSDSENRWLMRRPMMKRPRYLAFPRLFDDKELNTMMSSVVDEKEGEYVIHILNIPKDFNKDNLQVKLTNDGSTSILDISSDVSDENYYTKFDKRYIFSSSNVDDSSVKAKFDEKDRSLTVHVAKKPTSITNIAIE